MTGKKVLPLDALSWPAGNQGSPMADDRGTYALRGLIIGTLLMIAMWAFPIPVIVVVQLFHVQLPFGDIILLCIPLFLSIPIVGLTVGSFVRR